MKVEEVVSIKSIFDACDDGNGTLDIGDAGWHAKRKNTKLGFGSGVRSVPVFHIRARPVLLIELRTLVFHSNPDF